MLAEKFADAIELPQVGSVGYRRGTGQKVRVLRRNAELYDAGERTCLVKTFTRLARAQVAEGGSAAQGSHWYDDRGSSGNTTVAEADLFATEDLALHAGRLSRRGRR